MYIDEILCGHYEVLQIPYALYTIKQRTELLSLADKETRTSAEILDEMETKLQQLNREDFQTIRAMIDPEQRINISATLKVLVWDYEFYLSSLTAMKDPAFALSAADWKRFDKIITDKVTEIAEHIRTHSVKEITAYDPRRFELIQEDKRVIKKKKTVMSGFISKIDAYCREHPHHRITPKQMYRFITGTTNDNITPTSMKELDDYISMLNDLDCEICVIDGGKRITRKGKLIRIITVREETVMNGALIDQYYEIGGLSLLANIDDNLIDSISVTVPYKHLTRSSGKATDKRLCAEFLLSIANENAETIEFAEIYETAGAQTAKQRHDLIDCVKSILTEHYPHAALLDENGDKSTFAKGYHSISFRKQG